MISDRLVWIHIPKTAGDATLAMFEHLDVRFERCDGRTDPEKHASLPALRAKGFEPGERAVIANLRRLPEVALSYYHHMQRHGPEQRFDDGRPFGEMRFRDYVDYLVSHPESHSYDRLLEHYLGGREADHWIRVDRLAMSFREIVGRYHEIPPGCERAFAQISTNVGDYARDLRRWYRREDLEQLYGFSPRWSAAEREVYGSLLVEALAGEG